MIRSEHILPVGFTMLYLLYCFITPTLYPYTAGMNKTIFGVEYNVALFMRDIAWLFGAFSPAIVFIKDENLKRAVAWVFINQGAYMLIMLLLYNNTYPVWQFYVNLVFLIFQFLFTYFRSRGINLYTYPWKKKI